jgi:hypothetical protein
MHACFSALQGIGLFSTLESFDGAMKYLWLFQCPKGGLDQSNDWLRYFMRLQCLLILLESALYGPT